MVGVEERVKQLSAGQNTVVDVSGINVRTYGGTGVVTIGHILGMAAHIEGKGAALVDMVGI